MIEKRQIRLKEFSPDITKVHTPTDEYRQRAPRLEKGKSFFQRTNSFGFIETHLNYQAESKVILIGDSFIENIFVDESSRISSRIEYEFLRHNKKIKVYNAGVSGATGLGLINLVLNKIIPLKPDLIIYTQPSCDFSALLYKSGYYNDSKFFGNIFPFSGKDKQCYETIQENSYQLENNLIILSTMCKIYNIPLCIATCCSNSSKRQLKIMNDIIRKGDQYDIIDLDEIMPRNDCNFYDKQHLTQIGANYISNIFYNYLSSKLMVRENAQLSVYSIYFEHVDIQKNILLSNAITTHTKSSSSISLKIKNNLDKDINVELKLIDIVRGGEEITLLEINLPALNVIDFSSYIPENVNTFNIKLCCGVNISNSIDIIQSDLYEII
ncbi:SGNH/GDSL hydrolase family protein [Avibacterium avium]|uniref:SGNH hydrolase-type esterase domain-containing protein n=1 Tax=Avibacterium avium TaxID=751 RepID=A0A379AUD8_AVIAV|nr:SGNH/GDSL hydrolase family protein [Avibacterium avium]SUB24951.1 Uncharacterised protein [Avibacterium avium]